MSARDVERPGDAVTGIPHPAHSGEIRTGDVVDMDEVPPLTAVFENARGLPALE